MKQGHNDERPLDDDPLDTFSPPLQEPDPDDAYNQIRGQQLINDKNAVCRILRDNPLDTENMVNKLVDYVDSVRRFG